MTQEQIALQTAQKDLADLKALKNAKFPQNVLCPICGHRGETIMEKKNGPSVYLACLGVYMTIG